MSEVKLGATRGFRPWPQNRERLDYAEKLGLTTSQVINEVLEKHLKDYLKGKSTEIRKVLEAPMP